MKLSFNVNTAMWELEIKGATITMTPSELCELDHVFERQHWVGYIQTAIEENEEFINMEKMDEDEFIDECMAELESRRETCATHHYTPDYDDVVQSVAEDNDMWRDD